MRRKVILAAVTVAIAPIAWILRLYHETARPSDEPWMAWAYWPVLIALVTVGVATVFTWLPPGLQQRTRDLGSWSTASSIACVSLALSSAVVFGRVVVFARGGSWWFEAAWWYSGAIALLVIGFPVVTLLAAVSLWHGRNRATGPYAVLVILFSGGAIFLLLRLWVFLTAVACDACSGPAL